MTYGQGQTLQPGQKYVASFASNGVTAIGVTSGDVSIWEKGLPWITNSSWLNPLGNPYADWTFDLVSPIDAAALGYAMENVLDTFNPGGGFTFVSMADAGQGKAAGIQNDPNAPCSLSNLGACFAGTKSLVIWGVVGLVLIAFLASGGPGLIRSVTGK